MSRQLLLSLLAIALLALASIVIGRQVLQIESLQTRVAALENQVADIGKLKRLPIESVK